MKLAPILFLVKRNFPLPHRRKQSTNKKKQGSRPLLGAILGIALSLIPLTVVIHISDGMIRGITDRSIETSTYHFQVYSYNQEKIEAIEDMAKEIKDKDKSQEIIHTHIERQGFGLVYNDTNRMGTTIRALSENIFEEDSQFASFIEMKEGKFDLSGSRSILLGLAVAQELEVSVGDNVKLLSARVLEDGTVIPKILKFKVTGIFSTGYQELDKIWTIIPFETGKIILSLDNSRTFIGVKVADPYKNTGKMKNQLYNITDGDWQISDWHDQSLSQQNSLRTTKALLILIMVVLVFVAVINVSSSLTMVVLEQQQTIGILKCTGTAPSTITGVYLIIGTIAGILGAVLGLTTGTLFSLFINEIIFGLEFIINEAFSIFRFIISGWIPLPEESIKLVNTAYYLDSLSVKIQSTPLIISAISTVILSISFSAYPAVKAGMIRPLDVIRKF